MASFDPRLRNALKQAVAQGGEFQLRGGEVVTDVSLNPVYLARLWHHVADEKPYLDLIDRLGVTVRLIETREALRAAIRQIEQDKRTHGRAVGIDLETTAPSHRQVLRFTKAGQLARRQVSLASPDLLDSHMARIATAQLYAGGPVAFVFRGEALDILISSSWLRRQYLVAHSAGFEVKFLAAANAYQSLKPPRRSTGTVHCTLQSTALLMGPNYAPDPLKLSTVARHLLGVEVAKDYATSDWAAPTLSPGQLAYAGADAVLTRRIHIIHGRQLVQCGRQDAYTLQRGCIPAVAAMEHRGLGFDRDQHIAQVERWEQERVAALAEFQEITGRPAPRKPRELAAWIESVLPPGARWPRTQSGQISTAGKHLKRLASIPAAHPVLTLVRLDKLISAFGRSLLTMVHPVTGRLHAHYMIAGAKTGRFTCSKPNLQQLPASKAPQFKRVAIPAPGYLHVGADFNQVEMRGAGFLAQEPAMYDLFANNLDLHRETAATIGRIPSAEVTKEQRQRAKCISFGTTYGMQAKGLCEYAFEAFDVVMTPLEAQQALDRIAMRFPRLDRWKRDHYRLCQRRGYVDIGCGRVVKAEWEANNSLWFALCCNLPIQGICADAMMRAIQLTHMRLRQARLDAFIVATVHDELLIEARESDASAAAEILHASMTTAFEMTFPGFSTNGLVDVVIGSNWAEVKR